MSQARTLDLAHDSVLLLGDPNMNERDGGLRIGMRHTTGFKRAMILVLWLLGWPALPTWLGCAIRRWEVAAAIYWCGPAWLVWHIVLGTELCFAGVVCGLWAGRAWWLAPPALGTIMVVTAIKLMDVFPGAYAISLCPVGRSYQSPANLTLEDLLCFGLPLMLIGAMIGRYIASIRRRTDAGSEVAA